MRIGLLTTPLSNLAFEGALDRAVDMGASAVELGSGGYPGRPHCPVDELLESEGKRREYMQAVVSRSLIVSAFSCHANPLHPDPGVAGEADEVFRKSIILPDWRENEAMVSILLQRERKQNKGSLLRGTNNAAFGRTNNAANRDE
jgi:sugar phosphate isomerase/epimerase